MTKEDKFLYILDLRFPDHPARRVEVIGKVNIGSDETNDLCIQDYSLSPSHCLFRVINGILSLHNLAPDGKTLIGEQGLKQGRMYILDKSDEIHISDIEIIIRTENIAAKEELELKAQSNSDLDKILKLGKEETQASVENSVDEVLLDEASLQLSGSNQKSEDVQDRNLDLDLDLNLNLNLNEESRDFQELKVNTELEVESFRATEKISKISPGEQDQSILKKFSQLITKLNFLGNLKEKLQSNKDKRPIQEKKDESSVSINELLEASTDEKIDKKAYKKPLFGSLKNLFKFNLKKKNKKKEKIQEDNSEEENSSNARKAKMAMKNASRKKTPPLMKKRNKGKKKSRRRVEKVPGFWPRFTSLILTLLMAYSVSTFIDDQEAKNIILKLQNLTKVKIPGFINLSILKITISFIAIDILSHVSLGTTMPLFVMGVKEDSSFIISRFKGLLRSLIGLFTTALVIFDLPLIMQRRGLKEVMTFSRLKYRTSWMKYLIIIFVPLDIFISISLPLIQNLNLLKGPKIIERNLKSKSLNPTSKSTYILKTSLAPMNLNFHLMASKELMISPEAKITKGSTTYSLRFLGQKTGEYILLSSIRTVPYSKFTKLAQMNNPIFESLYPKLVAIVKSNHSQINTAQEFTKFTKSILKTNLENLIFQLPTLGPFLAGPLEFKREFQQVFNITESHQMTYFNLQREARTYTALYIRSNRIKAINRDKILLFLKQSVLELHLIYPKTSKKLAKRFPNMILRGMFPMNQVLKQNSKIGKALNNALSTLSQLKTNCALVTEQNLKDYQVLIDSNLMKVTNLDTKANTLVKGVLKSSLQANTHYIDKLNIDDCAQSQRIRTMTSEAMLFKTKPVASEQDEEAGALPAEEI